MSISLETRSICSLVMAPPARDIYPQIRQTADINSIYSVSWCSEDRPELLLVPCFGTAAGISGFEQFILERTYQTYCHEKQD